MIDDSYIVYSDQSSSGDHRLKIDNIIILSLQER